MRREQFSLAVADVAWVETDAEPELPTLTLAYDGDPDELRDLLLGGTDEPAADADLTVRLQRSLDASDAEAVVALTHRLTGHYILEVAAAPNTVHTFTRAARQYGEATGAGAKYRVLVVADEEVLAEFEKETLLVYGPDGELLRRHSLIPSGVEL